nr:hypothetical protein [Candidatus Sigynarchaeota archaeon]
FIDRSWLKKPEEGGKTQREIIDHLMLFISQKNGQKELVKNHRLESSRAFNANRERFEAQLRDLKIQVRSGNETCEVCAGLPSKKQVITTKLRPEMEHLIEDPTGVHDLVRCGQCGACFNVATREGKTWVMRIPSLKMLKQTVVHVMAEHGGRLKNWEPKSPETSP